jgi:hypothetical protein
MLIVAVVAPTFAPTTPGPVGGVTELMIVPDILNDEGRLHFDVEAGAFFAAANDDGLCNQSIRGAWIVGRDEILSHQAKESCGRVETLQRESTLRVAARTVCIRPDRQFWPEGRAKAADNRLDNPVRMPERSCWTAFARRHP